VPRLQWHFDLAVTDLRIFDVAQLVSTTSYILDLSDTASIMSAVSKIPPPHGLIARRTESFHGHKPPI